MIAIFINIIAALFLAYLGAFVSKIKSTNKIPHLPLILGVSFISGLQALFIFTPIGINLDFFIFILIYFNIGFWSALLTRNSTVSIKVWGIAMTPLVLFYMIFSTVYLGQAENIATRIDVVQKGKDFDINKFYENLTKDNARKIPYDTAIALAKKSLDETTDAGENLSNVLEIDRKTVSIQIVNNEEYWIVPLKYTGTGWAAFMKQMRYGDIDAYVKIKSQIKNTTPELVISGRDTKESFHMTKSMGGFFHKNLERNFHSNYPMDKITAFRMVVDDNFMPYMAAYTVKSVTGVDNYVPEGVILYNYSNETYTKHLIGESPEWIEVDVNINEAMNQLTDWGTYRKGIWKSFWNTFATELTDYEAGRGRDMFLVKTAKGYSWFSGMTSANKTNDSIIELAFVDTKTGKATLIKASGADENGIIESVQSKLGVNSQKWQALMPIKYLVANEFDVWVLPIIDKNTSLVQKMAIVDAQVIGRISVADTLEEAEAHFLKIGGYEEKLIQSKDKTIYEGNISRVNMVGLNNIIFSYFSLNNNIENIIECNSNISNSCLILKEGDFIKIDVFDKDNGLKSVSKIHEHNTAQ